MRYHRSFTLVEIMIVIAIIAILVGMAIPSLTKNRNAAYIKAQEFNIATCANAVNQYLTTQPNAIESDVTFNDIIPYLDDPSIDDITDLNTGYQNAQWQDGKLIYVDN